MIKARKDKTIIFGLSDENLKRLKKGQPISFSMADLKMGLDDIDVIIFNGRTEEDMMDQILDLGKPGDNAYIKTD